ncbi:MAG: hypothetical protein KJ630_12035 [Proteobacteria bacterium]|nr:hypothetical protein [Pseudomonadota bacterium]
MPKKRVLIVYYSYTQQTKTLLKKFIYGLESGGVEVSQERLEPLNPYEFPFRSNIRLAIAMAMTFFQKRMTIKPLAANCFGTWDCIILAGPTWSYHPSGPVLDFLDRYGRDVCGGKKIIPFISCRSYWRLHYWTLKRRLVLYGSEVNKPIVFLHPQKEPWRFIGLILQLRGKMMRRENSWFRHRYPGYGHSKRQGGEAMEEGKKLAIKLRGDWCV